MPFADYDSHDALGLAELVARREVAPAELLDAAIARIEARDGALGAVRLALFERARAQAARITPGAGPLAGVPYAIKDLGVGIEGVPTAHGTALLADVPAPATSTIVRRLEAAGLVICARTAASEFGLSYTTEPKSFPPTRNPWNPARSAGGSSGGAAAAVAAGMLPAAHASDGGGSIRVPAACCGLFGLKPTRGRVPLGPRLAEGWSGMATQHAVTRSVRDSAALLDATAGFEDGDPYWPPPAPPSYLAEVGRAPGHLRIALQLEADPGHPTHPACRAAAEDAARLCESLGHTVAPAAPAFDAEAFATAFLTIVGAHTADEMRTLARGLGREPAPGELETLTLALAERGRGLSAGDYAGARNVLLGLGRVLGGFFRDHDVLLSPTLAQPPAALGALDTDAADVEAMLARMAAYSPFTQVANATGCPAMSVPLAWSDEGLPLGVMFTAAMGREDLLLRLAGQLEQARPWFDRRPPGP